MKKKSTNSVKPRKPSADLSAPQAALEKIDRERKALEAEIIAKAQAGERSGNESDQKPKGTVRKSAKSKSQKRAWKAGRPPIPFDGFPLAPHASGKWQKKIRGKIHYFGNWGRIVNGKLARVEGDGWREALDLYQAQTADLHAGRTPRHKPGGGPTVADVCNEFYEAKRKSQKAGEITSRTLDDYDATCERIVKSFGKNGLVDDLQVSDFASLREELATQYGPVRLGNEVQRVRTVFKWGYENGIIEQPLRFGGDFKRPSKAVLRKHKASGGKKLFTADEIRRLLDAASPHVKAMVLLGINCGFGNMDCATLPQSAIDLKAGWHEFPRGKTTAWASIWARKQGTLDSPSHQSEGGSMIQVTCPACNHSLNAPDEFAGRKAKCRKCGQVMRVPSASAGKLPVVRTFRVEKSLFGKYVAAYQCPHCNGPLRSEETEIRSGEEACPECGMTLRVTTKRYCRKSCSGELKKGGVSC